MAKVSKQFSTKKNALHVLAAAMTLGLMVFVAYRAMNSSLFQLKTVNVIKLSEGYPLQVSQVLDLARVPVGKSSLFDVELKPVENRLLKNPWVKGVVIGKEFPNTLSLRVIERSPIALIHESKGKVSYLEEDGTIFHDQSLVYPKDLPMIQGFSVDQEEGLSQIRALVFEWFQESRFPGIKVSSISYDEKNGLRAVILYPLKNGQFMRPVVELGIDLEEALEIPQASFKKVLDYLSDRSLSPSKIWLGDGKKIVVKMSRGS